MSVGDVAKNGGTVGVDGVTITQIEKQGVEASLATLASELEDGAYRPLPVRRTSLRDRVQAAARLVLEPIFEADFPRLLL
jgi:RNA-directed DNA polymerase